MVSSCAPTPTPPTSPHPLRRQLFKSGHLDDSTLFVGTPPPPAAPPSLPVLSPSPTRTQGYARSALTAEALIERVRPFLKVAAEDEGRFRAFSERCVYCQGAYDQPEAFAGLDHFIAQEAPAGVSNRLFYLALPPTVFIDVTQMIKRHAWSATGWNRVIVEKPFGRDSGSSATLSAALGELFREEELFRIDHYLGKEMVQNLTTLRFANRIFAPLWNRDNIASVQLTFKEPFGTGGRGGYFDSFGIIRDIMQNHLMQVLTIVAMERPATPAADDVRDEKVKVMKNIEPVRLSDVITGQYVANDSEPGYRDDPGVPEDSRCPTFATAVLRIQNERWDGVPFIMRAGKALNERKAEVRIQFKDVPGNIFAGEFITPRNELVLRIQVSGTPG